jgi:hypothetical protein
MGGIITAPQMAFLITQETSKNDKSIRIAIESLLPIQTSQPSVFADAVSSLFKTAGGPEAQPAKKPENQTTNTNTTKTTSETNSKTSDEVREVIMICIDVSGSMCSPFESDRNRLEV